MGASAGVMYSIQVVRGVMIAMSYVASEENAFSTLDEMYDGSKSREYNVCSTRE
jgi:quinol-cytochrome oxidoreductase complex cytochrome b subunit